MCSGAAVSVLPCPADARVNHFRTRDEHIAEALPGAGSWAEHLRQHAARHRPNYGDEKTAGGLVAAARRSGSKTATDYSSRLASSGELPGVTVTHALAGPKQDCEEPCATTL